MAFQFPLLKILKQKDLVGWMYEQCRAFDKCKLMEDIVNLYYTFELAMLLRVIDIFSIKFILPEYNIQFMESLNMIYLCTSLYTRMCLNKL